ncbi:MAG TPA: 4Fe-4S dicluster domain-containing protein [candidate division WOR-3 bacterium]|uniref:4Fe-4S dicluster domain-containing protein n=1 Tax=candidate division WOR-3 bacterium TaxID=2052148 RepID=A0A7V0T664_UNCW3|nr:4Fe-4S dicluster domain-containing protein [candidate division WOR-3 bacterium]
MAKRKIIRIEEEKCTGCGECIPECPEGALQLIDGKARLVSDLFCDGLGACVGHCPTGAMTIVEREAEPYDEAKVMENIVRQGPNTIRAHLAHLKEHGAMEYHRAALDYLKRHHVDLPEPGPARPLPCGCPGTAVRVLSPAAAEPAGAAAAVSRLRNWPVQLMLVPVTAPYLKGADLLIAADCVGAALPDFHDKLVKGRVLLIACPKLDDAGFYAEKLTELFRTAEPKSVTVAHMTVPCCFGLVQLVRQAIAASGRVIPLAEVTVGVEGRIIPSERS